MDRQAGLLFPLSVLPGSYGIGDFGRHAYELVDKMSSAHISLWQILPLNPLGYGNSPYQPLSSHAGDEIYLSLADFINEGLLNEEEVSSFHTLYTFVDYQEVRKVKEELYHKAFSRFKETEEYKQFIDDNSWVESYAIFKVFKSHNDEKSWLEWEDEYKYYYKEKTFSLTPFFREIDYQKFIQYYFFKQWKQLKKYANDKGISIIGDMPIYVGLDSVDVWTNQECFLLEDDGTPSFVAGVPPDYFSKFGQRWGNPLYDWDYLKETHFAFWVDRMKAASEIYDTVRIDHFRAFDTYWKVPESESTAIIGEWVEAPGYELFDVLFREVPSLSILAEDLGELRDEVYDLRDHYHLKGMYVFEFHYCYEFDFEKVVV
ncbi:MAG: 4-alpha-glucanotransferase, partial [Coprobacillus sp.]